MGADKAVPRPRSAAWRSDHGAEPSATKYEERLTQDKVWALSEGNQYFQGEGQVQTSLQKGLP